MSATAAMIYSDKSVARMIMGKMAKRHPDDDWKIEQVPTGFQVKQIVTTPLVVTVNKPSGGKTMNFVPKSKGAAPAGPAHNEGPSPWTPFSEIVEGIAKKKAAGHLFTAVFVYRKQTEQFLEIEFNGKVTWVQKSSVASYDIDHEILSVTITMPIAYAMKRGFVPK